MRRAGLQGIMRGHVVGTMVAGDKSVCPLDHIQRQFHADRPNQLWVSDFTYASIWRAWVYAAFVIDDFCAPSRWLASQYQQEDRLRAGCPGASPVCPPSKSHGRSDPSQRPRQVIRLDPLHRTTGLSWSRAFGWQQGRQL